MKIFLFMYPIEKYIMSPFPPETKAIRRLSKIIDVRYRMAGYNVWWLMFGKNEDPSVPDMALRHPMLKFTPEDNIISANLSFERHCKEKVYPSCDHVLEQLPPVTELMIGGFHIEDCVDKMATCAHGRGIKTFVDEDTTDRFFVMWYLKCQSPVVRTRQKFARIFLNFLRHGGQDEITRALGRRAIKIHREERAVKPWLVPI